MTENKVYALLEKRFAPKAWALLPQVRNGTGFSRKKERTADALAVSLWPSRGIFLTGIEIKVSRSDWLRELSDPTKADAFHDYCRYWYVAAPKGVVDIGEVPETWGLLECKSTTSMREVKPAQRTEEKAPDLLLLASIIRKLHETTVPAADIDERIKRAAEEARQSANKFHEHQVNCELRRLKSAVERFEHASGVKIHDRWTAGNIASAVKFVLETGVDRAIQQVRCVYTSVQNTANHLATALEKLEKETNDAN